MREREKRLGSTVLALLVALGAGLAVAQEDLVERFQTLTRGTQWQQVSAELVDFQTFHTQGMTRVGDAFFVSSVEIVTPTERYPELREGYDRTPGEGVGHLFKFDRTGRLLDSVSLGEGDMYHPGGIDFDGEHIWVPVAEYRPNSASIIYRVDPETMEATEVFRFPDHIGGIVHNPDRGTLHGVSWGSRRLYTWQLDDDLSVTDADEDPESLRTLNKQHYIDYQDCQYVGNDLMLCSGLTNYRMDPQSPTFPLGGLELVDLATDTPIYQVPVTLFTEGERRRVMTQNPFFVETTESGLRVYFMPEDDESHLFVYEIDTE
jgi:hypothetical protein